MVVNEDNDYQRCCFRAVILLADRLCLLRNEPSWGLCQDEFGVVAKGSLECWEVRFVVSGSG